MVTQRPTNSCMDPMMPMLQNAQRRSSIKPVAWAGYAAQCPQTP